MKEASDRETILEAIPSPVGNPPPSAFERFAGRQESYPKSDWVGFDEAFLALGGQVIPLEALPLILSRDGGVWADEDTREFLPGDFPHSGSVWDAEVGVCMADLAIAETGSLLVSAGPGRSRLTSLAPPVNVVLIRDHAIVGTPEDVFERLPRTTSVLISGTSRTGDIEGILVRGVHGPRELYLVRLPADDHPASGS